MRKLLVILSIVLSLFTIYSQEVDITTLNEKEIVKYIDKSIDERDENILTVLEELGPDNPGFRMVENYLLKKAEELIKLNSIKFAQQIVESILYNDLENEEAQKLYAITVDKKIEIAERIEAEKIIAEKKREELEEIEETLNEEISTDIYMANVLKTNNELFSVIESYEDNFKRSNYFSSIYIYPLTIKNYLSQPYDGYVDRDATTNHFNGQGIDLSLGNSLGIFNFRSDSSISFTYDELPFGDYKQFTGSEVFSLGFRALEFPIFLRTGFLYDLYYFEDDLTDVAITSLPSPTLGIGITSFKFLKVLKLDLSADALLVSMYTDNFDYGVSGKAYLTVNIIKIGDQNIELKGGLDIIYLSEGGLAEYSYTPRLGFGITSYE